MCTPSGYLFSREAILENLLDQKKANKRKLAAWEAQQAEDARKQVREGDWRMACAWGGSAGGVGMLVYFRRCVNNTRDPPPAATAAPPPPAGGQGVHRPGGLAAGV